uniref:Uncharacterized protein n=1 Tax=Arundo donax TaxID=35708 RepID=A0A0A9BSQ0_ARUDO
MEGMTHESKAMLTQLSKFSTIATDWLFLCCMDNASAIENSPCIL